jgi:uncharacterized protein (DUF58 family)
VWAAVTMMVMLAPASWVVVSVLVLVVLPSLLLSVLSLLSLPPLSLSLSLSERKQQTLRIQASPPAG